jgi:hypothetical protein
MSQENKDAGHKGASATVTVACKLPHGLTLRLFKMEPFEEAVVGGGVRQTKKAMQVGEVVKLNGYAAPHGHRPLADVVGGKFVGYALTPDVPREYIEEWLRQNPDLPAVKNGLIFIAPDRKYAADKAEEVRGQKNGLEPLDMRKDPNDKNRPVDPRARALAKGNAFQFGTYDKNDGL